MLQKRTLGVAWTGSDSTDANRVGMGSIAGHALAEWRLGPSDLSGHSRRHSGAARCRVQASGRRSNPRYQGVPHSHRHRWISRKPRNVVVYVEKVDDHVFSTPAQHPSMAQQDKEFNPNVLPIVVGQTVDFPNRDSIYHDVYSESPGNKCRHRCPGYKSGTSPASLHLHPPGTGRTRSAWHSPPFMNGYILVLQKPCTLLSLIKRPRDCTQISGISGGTYEIYSLVIRWLDEQTHSVIDSCY